MTLDIVVSFDTTGSMSPAIAEVRRKVSEFIDTLFNQVEGLRIGLITHGDYCDGNKLINMHPLSSDRTSLINFVRTAPNTGGGDEDEAYEYVLHEVQKLDWQANNRVFLLIGDCSPHQVGYRYGAHTNYYDWVEEARKCYEVLGIKIYPIQALNRRENNKFYDNLAAICNTIKLPLNQFTDIIPLLTAVTYSQQSQELVQSYGDELQEIGQMNRGIAAVFDLLLGEERYGAVLNRDIVSRTVGDKYELREVDPARFQVLHIDHNIPINEFVRSTGADFRKGRGFYELTKAELVQERKEVVLRDKKTGDMWSGIAAREMIGLPYGIRGKVHPKHGFDYDVFIQSTSANRKLMGGTRFLYEAK